MNLRIGKYQVLAKIGEGGMGSVFCARHAQIGRRVAIKVLLPQHVNNRDVLRRFFDEARATAEVRHPGVIEIFDFGELDDGSAYLVMELLDGETLARRIARGAVGAALTAEIGRQLASAVAAAHDRGIVHRDLKPENIILVADPDLPFKVRVKVLDFGIAKLMQRPQTIRTVTRLLLGTPAYMSPEQCRGAASVDHRTDIYAIGCILFEMICGRLPFAFDNMADLMAAHINDEPPDPLALVPTLPLSLRDAIQRCLEKNPSKRYATAAALAAALSSNLAAPRKASRAKRAAIVDEETRFDPSIATRIAAEWDVEPTKQGWRRSAATRSETIDDSSRPATLVPDARVSWQARLPILAVLGGALGVAAAVVSATLVPAAKPAEARSPSITAAKPAMRPVAPDVELRIETLPSGAEVVSGSVVIGTTPLRISTRAAAGSAEVEIRLDGFAPRRIRFDTDRDEHFTIRLRPRSESPPATRAGGSLDTTHAHRYAGRRSWRRIRSSVSHSATTSRMRCSARAAWA